MIDWDTIRFFKPTEFACRCGCGLGPDRMDPLFVRRLDALRQLFGRPMVLSSAYRCPTHNQRVSSSGATGPHTTGKAVDVLASGHAAQALLFQAARMNFPGIGVAQKGPHERRFIHLDWCDHDEAGPRPWVWSY